MPSKGGTTRLRTSNIFRQILASAWNDFYSEFYDWCIYKIKKAGTLALRDYLTIMLGSRIESRGLAYLVAYVASSCVDMKEVLRCSQVIDNIVAPLELEEIYINVADDGIASRSDALSAFECVLKIMSRLDSCKEVRSPLRDPISNIFKDLRLLERSFDELSIVGLKNFYIVVANDFRGLRYRERISLIMNRFTLVPLILLTPEEAFTVIKGSPMYEEAEFIRDDFMLSKMVDSD